MSFDSLVLTIDSQTRLNLISVYFKFQRLLQGINQAKEFPQKSLWSGAIRSQAKQIIYFEQSAIAS